MGNNRLDEIHIIEAAAGNQAGSVRLTHGINGRVEGSGAGDIEVPSIYLDGLGLSSIGFVKIDVEGYEWPVLQGAVRMIERDRPNLFIEIHQRSQENQGDLHEIGRFLASY